MANEKINASIPISQYPCAYARDIARLPDDAFMRRHGVPKALFPKCNCLDLNDKKRNDSGNFDAIEALTTAPGTDNNGIDLYEKDMKNHQPQAEAVVYDGRTVLPSCVNHANHLKDFLLKMERHLQLMRPTLNPGENNNMQRRFIARAQRRKEARRSWLNKLVDRRREEGVSSIKDIPEPEMEYEVYEGDESPILNTNNLSDDAKRFLGMMEPGD